MCYARNRKAAEIFIYTHGFFVHFKRSDLEQIICRTPSFSDSAEE